MTSGTSRSGRADDRQEPHAAMEPARDERDQWPDATQLDSGPEQPQWSPLVTSGTRRAHHLQGGVGDQVAAMEPDRDERDQLAAARRAESGSVAAMEPDRDERDQQALHRHSEGGTPAAMEPARDERDQSSSAANDSAITRSPQWSPLVTSGTSRLRLRAGPLPRMCRNGARS